MTGRVPDRRATADGSLPCLASVGAGASAQRQNDPCRGQAEGEEDRFAEAAAGGVQGFQLAFRQERQAAGIGDLDDGGFTVEGDARLNRLAGGACHRVAAAGEARGDGGVDAAVAAVCQGKQFAPDRPGRAGHTRGGTKSCSQCLRYLAWR